MREAYIKEEVTYCDRLPARIIHQILSGAECFTPMHWHNEIELNLMMQGKAEFTVNGKKRLLMPGDFILINSQDVHMGEYPTSTPIGERFQELLTILLDYEFLRSYAQNVSELRFLLPEEPEKTRDVREYVQSIAKHFIQGGQCFEMQITADLLRLGSILLCNYVVQEEQLAKLQPLALGLSEMQKAVAYIEKHYEEALTLEKISEYMNLSPNYFSKRFRQMTGVTFRSYLCNQRLKSASRDLLNTDMNITEIAFKNGFPNVKSFIDGFRKIYQVTPERYRRSSARS